MKGHKSTSKTHTKRNEELTGTLALTQKGIGFIRTNDRKNDILIEHQDLGTGLQGDSVNYILLPKSGSKQKARVTKILTRAKVGFAGILDEEDGVYKVITQDPKMYRDIIIPESKLNKAKVKDKVFAIITTWENQNDSPIGEIKNVLGREFEHTAEMEGIILERGFDSTFHSAVEHEAQILSEEKMEVGTRRDLRSVTTFTIDPFDAKDFDDALSIAFLNDGLIEVGIHIADVSHYVREKSKLDAEAFRRGTSVYLVDRTIPMLPEILSNNLCSLKPDVDRLTMSAIFILDHDGKIHESWYGRTIIHSDKRFTYEEAQKVLDDKNGEFYEELNVLNNIAKKLSKKRHDMGSITFETDEVKFELDKNFEPIRAYRKVRGDTHKLIEEWMLLANRKVAELFKDKNKGMLFMYRIHDLPDGDKIADFRYLIEKLGYTLPKKDKIDPKDLNKLLYELENKPEKDMLSSILIRSMAKAVYSTKNIGHFGLGFEHYTHFTSPIRRYPDIMVHRLLEHYLKGRAVSTKEMKNYERSAQYASERERSAAEAERASVKYKQVEYMAKRVGEVFDGIITGVSEYGMYVEERETKSEGMINVRELGTDQFRLNERELTLTGTKTHKKFRLGDKIKIKVLRADLAKRVIDYTLA